MTNRKSLARTSGTPGKTQTINFFRVTLKTPDDTRHDFYLVDLPGYGYAKTSKTNRKLWAKFIDEYLSSRRDIKFVCQLKKKIRKMGAVLRHREVGFNANALCAWQVPPDKLGKTERQKHLDVIKNSLGVDAESILPYSSIKNEGRSELLDVIINSLIK